MIRLDSFIGKWRGFLRFVHGNDLVSDCYSSLLSSADFFVNNMVILHGQNMVYMTPGDFNSEHSISFAHWLQAICLLGKDKFES